MIYIFIYIYIYIVGIIISQYVNIGMYIYIWWYVKILSSITLFKNITSYIISKHRDVSFIKTFNVSTKVKIT